MMLLCELKLCCSNTIEAAAATKRKLCFLLLVCWMLESWRVGDSGEGNVGDQLRSFQRLNALVVEVRCVWVKKCWCHTRVVRVLVREKEPRFTFLASLCYLSTYYRILFLSRDHNKDRVGRHCRHYSLAWYAPLHGRVVQVPAIAAMS